MQDEGREICAIDHGDIRMRIEIDQRGIQVDKILYWTNLPSLIVRVKGASKRAYNRLF